MFSIKQFQASINDKGILRSNKYFVTFKVPEYLSKMYTNSELMSLRCESASIPGFTFLTNEGAPRFGYGAIEKIPYLPAFDQMNLTFIVDSNSIIYKFFFDWTMTIVNFDGRGGTNFRGSPGVDWKPYEVGYKKYYQTDINIDVYDGSVLPNSDSTTGNLVMKVKAFAAFPLGLPSNPLAWDSTGAMKLTIPFTYTDLEITK